MAYSAAIFALITSSAGTGRLKSLAVRLRSSDEKLGKTFREKTVYWKATTVRFEVFCEIAILTG